MHSHTVGPDTGNVHQCYPAWKKKTKNSVGSVYVRCCAVHISGAFSPTYLQVVDAHRATVSSGHVVVHTLPKAAQTGRVGVVAGVRPWRGSQQKTAWAGGVLAWALALGLLQRHGPAGQEVQIFCFLMNRTRYSWNQMSYFSLLTWQSRFQRGWPDKIPWCTLGDSSPAPRFQSLHNKHTL